MGAGPKIRLVHVAAANFPTKDTITIDQAGDQPLWAIMSDNIHARDREGGTVIIRPTAVNATPVRPFAAPTVT